MNPANLHDAIVSSWQLLNAAIVAGAFVALSVGAVTAAFREFGTRRLRWL